MLPLNQGTNTVYADMSVATPETIQPRYNKFHRFLQNQITFQEQSNIDMWFNS